MGRPLKDHEVRWRHDGVKVSSDFERPVVRCRLCEKVWTESTGTNLCDPCWELECRVQMDPDLAREVLKAIDS